MRYRVAVSCMPIYMCRLSYSVILHTTLYLCHCKVTLIFVSGSIHFTAKWLWCLFFVQNSFWTRQQTPCENLYCVCIREALSPHPLYFCHRFIVQADRYLWYHLSRRLAQLLPCPLSTAFNYVVNWVFKLSATPGFAHRVSAPRRIRISVRSFISMPSNQTSICFFVFPNRVAKRLPATHSPPSPNERALISFLLLW